MYGLTIEVGQNIREVLVGCCRCGEEWRGVLLLKAIYLILKRSQILQDSAAPEPG